jgi:hypothetical protein
MIRAADACMPDPPLQFSRRMREIVRPQSFGLMSGLLERHYNVSPAEQLRMPPRYGE